MTDFYIVVTGNSPPHLRALSEGARLAMKERGVVPHGASGVPESGWMALDFVDVIIHIFEKKAREYYAIEDLWQGCPRVE